jgi:hypothetical protein
LIYFFGAVLIVGWAVILDEVIRNIIAVIHQYKGIRSKKSAELNDQYLSTSG